MGLVTPPYVLASASHSAELFRDTIQSHLGASGVIGSADLAVAAITPAAMKVKVAEGQILIPGTLGATGAFPSGFTQQGTYYSYVNAVTDLTIATSTPTNPRIDSIVASIQDSEYSGSTNQALLQVVTGTPAATPSPPATPASSVVLAHVRVPAAASSIVTGDITDERTFAGFANALRGNPAGRMYPTATTTIINAQVQVGFMTTTFTKGGVVRTGNQLVVPVAGVYLVSCQITWEVTASNPPPSGYYYQAIIEESTIGNLRTFTNDYTAAATSNTLPTSGGSDYISLPAGAKIQLQGKSAATVGVFPAVASTWLSLALVSQ